MIKHIVMFRLEKSALGDTKQENVKKLKTVLESLREKIVEIKHLEVGISFAESETSSDVVLYSEFANKEALDAYQKHPEHLKVVDFVKQVCAERRVVDYIA
ncbi:MAG: Dabb family protein [Nitrospira sp.]|nr:Dabb family protein [Nitrospira sp.]